MSDPDFASLSEAELRLTAALYAMHRAGEHLRATGRLPDVVGGSWSSIPLQILLKQRGRDFELTAEEQQIYDALVRERRLPGGCVRLVDPGQPSPAGTEEAIPGASLDPRLDAAGKPLLTPDEQSVVNVMERSARHNGKDPAEQNMTFALYQAWEFGDL